MTVYVSVIISVYNDQAFVGYSIESILNQTFTDFEVIIINDGSTDNSASEINKFTDPRIRVYQKQNSGLAESLNFGISISHGKYIARQDSDDYSMPTRFEQQVNFLRTHQKVGLVGCNSILIDESGNELAITHYPTENSTLQATLLDEKSINPFNHGSVIFSRDLALNVGGYRKEFKQSQDLDLWLRMAEKTEIANLSEPLYLWRLRHTSVNIQNWNNQRDFGHLARICAKQRRDGQPESELSLSSTRKDTQNKISLLLRKLDSDSEYSFRIGILLFNQNSMAKSRSYILKVIKTNPFHLYAWLILFLSLFPKAKKDLMYHWIQNLYRQFIWK